MTSLTEPWRNAVENRFLGVTPAQPLAQMSAIVQNHIYASSRPGRPGNSDRKMDKVNYTYDAEGLRTSKTVNGEKTVFVWDGD